MTSDSRAEALPTPQAVAIDLGARYCAAVDAGDTEAVVALFAPDGVLTVRGVERRGPEALATFFEKAVRGIHVAGLPAVRRVADDELESVGNFLFVADGLGAVTRGTYLDRIRYTDASVFLARTIDIHPSGATDS
ncbi:MAG TPA: nuclear transport factor 2 family protein [Pseudolysinimonas sp.]|nr:nuclear transport factor 2 family protein [Pseudolysinimonas sp.]